MSTDAEFSPAAFPAVRVGVPSSRDAGERIRGHAAGFAAGLRAAAREQEEWLARKEAEYAARIAQHDAERRGARAVLEAAARAVRDCTTPVLADAQDLIAAGAIDLAEAVVGRELRDDTASARAVVHRVLAHTDTAVVVSVRLNPSDLAALDPAETAGLEYRADPSLRRGDAIAELPDGFLDAGITSAIERARGVLLGEGS
ncbi:FliH/SctL family protein [Cryobacterium sp. BB307]|uniref:FliH/SctL family protein n=1 Tax=Cryobacterium sp. BB307 TaxID=2716317 RepID=UPI001445D6AD|nr:FliH/SctL family protein [Cryobacterium sp. BB307]